MLPRVDLMSEKTESPRKYSRGVKSGLHEEFIDSYRRGIPFWLPEEFRNMKSENPEPENSENQAKKERKPSDNE